MIKAPVFLLGSLILSFAWAPVLINFLYKHNVRRRIRQEVDEKIGAEILNL